MQRQNFNDCHTFAGVARGRSSQKRRPAGFHFFGFIKVTPIVACTAFTSSTEVNLVCPISM